MGFGSATAFYFARGHNDSSLCGGPASLCRLVDSLQGPGYPFPTRGRWVGGGAVTRYKAFSRFFAARNVGWCGLPTAVGGASRF